MTISRRRLLQGLTGAAGASLVLAGCSTTAKTTSSSGTTAKKTTTLWYWGGGLSDKVVADAVKQFAGQATVKPSVIGGDFKQKPLTTMASHRYVPDITRVKGEDIASPPPHSGQFVDLNTLGAQKVQDQFL